MNSSKKVLSTTTELTILNFLEEMESLMNADDGTVFHIKHFDQVAEIRERLETAKYETDCVD